MHLLIRERLADGTLPTVSEDPGLPVVILYGPNATLKLGRQSPDIMQILQTYEECVAVPYQGRMRVTEQLQMSEWAMAGSSGEDDYSFLPPTAAAS
jgi:hypothetical protein